MDLTLQELLQQEESLRLEDYSHEDALRTGLAAVELAKNHEGPVAVEIEIGGLVVFRYYGQGTGVLHEKWIGAKRRCVRAMSKSSLRFWKEEEAKGRTREDEIMPAEGENAVLCGGGFPLKLKSGTLVGTLCVSGFADTVDHAIAVEALRRSLGK